MGIGAVPDDTTLRSPLSGSAAAAALDPYALRTYKTGDVAVGQGEKARVARWIAHFADAEPQDAKKGFRRRTSVDTGASRTTPDDARGILPQPGPQLFPIQPSLRHALAEGDVPADISFPHLPGRPAPQGLLPHGG